MFIVLWKIRRKEEKIVGGVVEEGSLSVINTLSDGGANVNFSQRAKQAIARLQREATPRGIGCLVCFADHNRENNLLNSLRPFSFTSDD